MRWLPFFILAYLALAIQAGAGAFAQFHGASPNLVLLTAVFIAMNAPRDTALPACFILGLMQDLLTASPLGLWAVAYGVVALFVISSQEFVYRGHFLTHIFLGLVAGLLSGTVVTIHGWVYPLLHPALQYARPNVAMLFIGAFYTALLAPLVLGVLQRIRRVFAFRNTRAGRMGSL